MPLLSIFKKKNIIAGTYIGYTQKKGESYKPTLYFENGRLTQEHPNPLNTGWHPHPVKSDNHIMVNIDHDKFVLINRPKPHRKENILEEVNTVLKQGDFDLPNGTDDLEEMVLVEYDLDKNENIISYHKSRGRLLRPGDDGFYSDYGETYARKQVRNARLAKNEKVKK